MSGLIVNLFSGAGGWEEGLRLTAPELLADTVGIEKEADAATTALMAGHRVVLTDVRQARVISKPGEIRGLIASPPCQSFSAAGKGHGRKDLDRILDTIRRVRESETPAEELRLGIQYMSEFVHDERSLLVLEPLLWILEHIPDWIAMEQVPSVMPVWQAYAEVLRDFGYQVVAEVLSAERYGVPQTRKRAVLIARHGRPVQLPRATHARYGTVSPDLPMAVGMADVLDWGQLDLVGFPRRSDGRDEVKIGDQAYRARDLRVGAQPAFTLTEKARSWQRIQFAGAGATAVRTAGQRRRQLDEPAHTITGAGSAAWCEADSEVTLARVTVEEAAVLQTFPRDYPWAGSRTSQFLQVGNAIPPVLAAAVLREVIQ